MKSLCADGISEIFVSLVGAVSAVFLWYTHSFYLNWIVFVAGIGVGVMLYAVSKFEEDHPVASFPITMPLVIIIIISLLDKALVAGAVATFLTMTAIKVYEVYLL